MALPDGGTGWYKDCDQQAAFYVSVSEHRVPRPIKIYATERGKHVVAWWYSDCDSDLGTVKPGIAHPQCRSSVPTSPG